MNFENLFKQIDIKSLVPEKKTEKTQIKAKGVVREGVSPAHKTRKGVRNMEQNSMESEKTYPQT